MEKANPGLSAESLGKMRSAVHTTLTKMRTAYGSASEADFETAEMLLKDAVERNIQKMRAHYQHFWATHYTAEEMRFLRQASNQPIYADMPSRLRLHFVMRRLKPTVEQGFNDLRVETRAALLMALREVDQLLRESSGG